MFFVDGSGPGWRRKSSSALQPAKDPLQFIALKPAVNLAKKAEQQIEIVKETKKRRESVDKDEAEWQFVSFIKNFKITSCPLYICE